MEVLNRLSLSLSLRLLWFIPPSFLPQALISHIAPTSALGCESYSHCPCCALSLSLDRSRSIMTRVIFRPCAFHCHMSTSTRSLSLRLLAILTHQSRFGLIAKSRTQACDFRCKKFELELRLIRPHTSSRAFVCVCVCNCGVEISRLATRLPFCSSPRSSRAQHSRCLAVSLNRGTCFHFICPHGST